MRFTKKKKIFAQKAAHSTRKNKKSVWIELSSFFSFKRNSLCRFIAYGRAG